jgi:hypothetical protein
LTTPDASTVPSPANRAALRAAVSVGLALLGVAAVSTYALLTVIVELVRALMIVVPPALAGLWLVPLLRLGRIPLRWHLLLGAALGLGAAALLVLGLGLAGLLHRGLWIALLTGMFVAGAVRLGRLIGGDRVAPESEPAAAAAPPGSSLTARYLPLLTAPFLSMALLAAATAPGQIWAEEGFGYDVLGYHLALPKEYHDAGRIAYAPHNVYANFPSNLEMLYLLAMVVHGDPVEAGTTANMIHLLLGVLAVMAGWAAAREWSPAAGVVALVALGSVGWLPYLSGLAYVENGMLFFGMVALGLLLHRLSRGADAPTDDTGHLGWIAAAGLAAGLACGCKYTALPLIAAPLALVAAITHRRCPRAMLFSGLVFTVAALLTFAPWLAKNQAMTGNPVFPLAASVFPSSPAGWGEDEAARWAAGHAPGPHEQSLAARFGFLWKHVVADPEQRFGPVILLAGVMGLIGLAMKRARTTDTALLILLGMQLIVWMFATHLYARFAVVMLMPLSLLAARALGERPGALRQRLVPAVLAAGCAWNAAFTAGLFGREQVNPFPASAFYDGEVPGTEYLSLVNHDLPPDSRVLLVGEARAFYFLRPVAYAAVFNRHPLTDILNEADGDAAVVERLRAARYTHVLVNWPEVARLSATYGMDPRIEPALFDRLEEAGLVLHRRFVHPIPERAMLGTPYVDVYEIPSVARPDGA